MLIFLLLLLLGCSAPDEISRFLPLFDTPRDSYRVRSTTVREERAVRRVDLEFPSALKIGPASNHRVYTKVWLPMKKNESRPALVVIHFLGATSIEFLQGVCHWLAREGIVSMMVYLPFYGPRGDGREPNGLRHVKDMAGFVNFFRQAVADVRRAREVLASLPEVNPRRVGLLGISLGALVAALAAGIDGQIPMTYLILGGGDLTRIGFHPSRETEFFRKIAAEKGWTPEQVREALRPIEPLVYASRIPRETVRMYNMQDDEVIPRDCTERLWESLGKPTIRWYPGGHKSLVFLVPIVLKDIVATIPP